jgi:hypothetical protein
VQRSTILTTATFNTGCRASPGGGTAHADPTARSAADSPRHGRRCGPGTATRSASTPPPRTAPPDHPAPRSWTPHPPIDDRHRQIGEHLPRRVHPRTHVGVSQRRGHPGDQTAARGCLPQQRHAGMRDHPSPSVLTFTRRGKPVELITEKVLLVLAGTDLRQSHPLAGQEHFPRLRHRVYPESA